MGLRDLQLKEEYRSDIDDIISEFFIPCLSNCREYNRCIEYISIKSLSMLVLGFDNFVINKLKLRIICGHRFNSSDLGLLTKLFGVQNIKISLNMKLIKDSKLQMLKEIVEKNQIEIKVAIPNAEEVSGSYNEKIGIFKDENNDMVAFTGISNETFNVHSRNFESIDVFTSWNDKSRICRKIKDFENLWQNKTEYVEVYDFGYAEKNNLLKYSPHWILDTG